MVVAAVVMSISILSLGRTGFLKSMAGRQSYRQFPRPGDVALADIHSSMVSSACRYPLPSCPVDAAAALSAAGTRHSAPERSWMRQAAARRTQRTTSGSSVREREKECEGEA